MTISPRSLVSKKSKSSVLSFCKKLPEKSILPLLPVFFVDDGRVMRPCSPLSAHNACKSSMTTLSITERAVLGLGPAAAISVAASATSVPPVAMFPVAPVVDVVVVGAVVCVGYRAGELAVNESGEFCRLGDAARPPAVPAVIVVLLIGGGVFRWVCAAGGGAAGC